FARSSASRRAAVFVLSLLAAASALAAPLAPPRGPRAVPKVLPSATSLTPLDRACGSDVDGPPAASAAMARHPATAPPALAAAYPAMSEHLATAPAALPTTYSTDNGEIAVLEDDGTFFYTDKNGNANVDVAAVGRAFYRTHGDDYDEVALWLSTGLTNWLG